MKRSLFIPWAVPLTLDLANEFNYIKEFKLISFYFAVPITQTWREELKKFTEAAGIKSKNPYTNTTSYQVPPSRQGSRQGEWRPPSRGHELPPPSRNGEKPPSRSGEKPPSRNGEKLLSRNGEKPPSRHMQHITADSDSDLTVSGILLTKIKIQLIVDQNASGVVRVGRRLTIGNSGPKRFGQPCLLLWHVRINLFINGLHSCYYVQAFTMALKIGCLGNSPLTHWRLAYQLPLRIIHSKLQCND